MAILQNHFANGFSREGSRLSVESEALLRRRHELRLAMPMDNPTPSLSRCLSKRYERKHEIPCGISSGESTRRYTPTIVQRARVERTEYEIGLDAFSRRSGLMSNKQICKLHGFPCVFLIASHV